MALAEKYVDFRDFVNRATRLGRQPDVDRSRAGGGDALA